MEKTFQFRSGKSSAQTAGRTRRVAQERAVHQTVEALEQRMFLSGTLTDKVSPPAPLLPIDPLNGTDKHALPGLPAAKKGPKKGPTAQETPAVTQTEHPRGGTLLFDDSHVIELAPETIDPRTGISPPHMSGRVADPADIIWVNRGLASDNFATTFGTFAATARAVVDAVIVRYEQMINSFDYSSAGQTYSLTLAMNGPGGGFGASANLNTSLGGKPKSGSITMGSGNNDGIANNDNGWFMDPTPFDNSEFTGNITNAFSGDAQGGSPAAGKGDFFTVVAAEMTHCMGLFGAALPGWVARVTNTGIHDGVTGVGNYWVFQGPSISHLGTSDNAGSSDFGSLIHSAEGGSAINFGGQFWRGAEDQGNAFYEFGRRCLVNNIFSLMFRDAYGYLSVNPASNAGTFYATLQSNGTLLVRGGDFAAGHANSADLIVLSSSGSNVTVTVDVANDVGGSGPFAGDQALPAFVSTFPAGSISNIEIQAGAGNDIIRIDGNAGKPTHVDGGDGDDFIDFSYNTRNLSTDTGNTNVNGGAGVDSIFTYDDGQTAAQTYTITDARFDRPGWGGFFYDVDIEGVNIWCGDALDTVNVQSTYVGQPLFIQNDGSNDVVNVGNGTNGIQSIQSTVTITNAPAFSTININDTGDTTARSGYVYWTGDHVYGFLADLAPAAIYYKLADVGTLNLTTGAGADSLIVYAETETMNLNSAGAHDYVQIGDAAVGGLPLITGAITVNNSPSFTDLVVTDAGDNSAKSANMDFAGSNAFGRVTALAPVPIVWNNNDISTVTVVTGNANDTMLLYSNTEDLRFNSAGGSDTLFMGSNIVGGLQFISGFVSVDNSTGSTIVVVDDLGATVTKTAVNVSHPAGTYTNVTSFAPATLRFADTGLTQVQLRSGTITAVQPDRFDVQATGVPLFFFNNGGNDAVNLGGGPLGADSLLAPVTVSGQPGSTTIGILDYGQANPRNMTLDDDTTYATLSGFGAFNHLFNLQTITSMSFSMGQGADTLNIRRARRPITYNNLNPGNPTDAINVGNATNGLNDIQTNIENGIVQSPVAITLTDSVNSANRTYDFQPQFFGTTLTGNRIVFNGSNYVAHTWGANTASVSINAGSGADTFNAPIVRTSPVFLNGAGGNDTFNIGTHTTQFSDPVYLLGDGGLDVLNVNADTGSTSTATLLTTMHFSNVNIGTGGDVTVAGGGNKLLSTRALTLGSDSTINLVDNDMILDYTGATQLPAVQAFINLARNGGVWNGTRGITSSAAASAVPKNTTLGALEASSFTAIYGAGAHFAGDALDSTMVLVKYTYYGDTDFNGVVNFDDYSRTDAGFNGNRSGWVNGDFDGNGVVNFDDYSLIDLAFNTQGAAL